MDTVDLLRPDAVIHDLRAKSKKHALQELAKHAARLSAQDPRDLCAALLARERLGTTGVGHGVAIPHAKIVNFDKLYGVFARLETPIDFDAVDGEPVDLIFLLLAPEGAGAEHLKALARVSRFLRDRENCAKLRGADSRDALLALLTDHAKSHAA